MALTKQSTPVEVDETTSTSNISNIDIVDNTFTEDVTLKVTTTSGEQIDEFLLPNGYTNVTFKTDEVTNYDAYNLNGDPIGTLVDNNEQPDIPTTKEYKNNIDVHLGAYISNPPIIIGDETMTVDEGSGTTSGSVTDVVSDPDNSDSELTYTLVDDAQHGHVEFTSDGSYTYTTPASPDENWNGIDTFTYEVEDPDGNVATGGTGIITVNPVNDSPVAIGNTYTIAEDEVILDEQLTASDPDLAYGDVLTYSILVEPQHGTVSIDPINGLFTYTPTKDYNGTDSFTFEVVDNSGETASALINIEVGDLNGGSEQDDAPVALDETHDLEEDEVYNGTLIATDGDIPYGDTLTYSIKTAPTNGIVTNLDPIAGTYTYTPNQDYVGPDSFTFEVIDSTGLSDTATITFNVGSENGGTGTNDAPVAEDDNFETAEDIQLVDTVVVNDYDVDLNDTLTYTLVENSTRGLRDATTHGDVVLETDGSFTYTPESNFVGTDTFTYMVTDSDGLTDIAVVTIEVGNENGGTGTNDAPEALNDNFETEEDEVLNEDVSKNDTDPDLNDTLSYNVKLGYEPTNGTVELATDGTFTYTPDANYVGLDTFTYVVTDSEGLTDEAIVTIEVGYENGGTGTPDAPIAEDDNFTIDEDEVLNESVTSNDYDVDLNDTLTYTLETDVVNGTLSLEQDGSFTYTPNANWTGVDTFTYIVTDNDGLTDTATVTINVGENGGTGNNDVPDAVDDSYQTKEDEVLTKDVSENDTDPDTNDTLSYAVKLGSEPLHGTVDLAIDGSFTYTPNANYVGPDTFTYIVTDSEGLTDEAVVTIKVGYENGGTGTPDAPVAEDDDYQTMEDEVLTEDVSANDIDVDLNDTLSYSVKTDVEHGTLDLAIDGTFTYTPDANYVGSDTFTYTVTDSKGLTDEAVVTIQVGYENGGTGTPDAPVAEDDDFETPEDVQLVDTVATNDYDVDLNDTLTYTLVENNTRGLRDATTHGEVVLEADGSFTYTPETNFVGTDTFTYMVTDSEGLTDTAVVTIEVGNENGGTGTNDAPEANDDSYGIDEDTVLIENVAINDIDPDLNDTLSYSIVSDVSHGTLVLNTDGTFEYTPDANYVGEDTFTYEVTDGELTDEAVVTITVGQENGGTGTNDAPEANDDSYAIDEDELLTDSVATNDVDPDANDTLTYSLESDVSNGTLDLNTDGTFEYTPNANWAGVETFTYMVTDSEGLTDTAIATIEVGNGGTGNNDAPVANDDSYTTTEDTLVSDTVATNDYDPDLNDTLTYSLKSNAANGTLTLATDGSFTYVPNTDFNGTDSFTYTVTDSEGLEDTATVTINVDGINDAPIAVDDNYEIYEDTNLMASVAYNDTDAEDTSLTYSLDTTTQHGILTLSANGTFTYTLDKDFTGVDTFTYIVTDSEGLTAVATATITINPKMDGPNAVDDVFSTDEDVVMTNSVATNDTDPENGTLTYSLGTDVNSGTLNFAADGTFTYTLDKDFTGVDVFTYTVTDDEGQTDTALVTITVNAANDNPDAVDDIYEIDESTNLAGSVAYNDVDAEDSNLTYSLVSNVTNGTLDFEQDGTFTYKPNSGFVGIDTFTYMATDSEGLTDTATVTISVGEVNEVPNAVDDVFEVKEGADLSGTVAENDTDDHALTYSLVNDVTHGTLNLTTDGTFTYSPDTGYVGTDTFTYMVTDSEGLTDTATVTIVITDENNAPIAEDDTFTLYNDTTLYSSVAINDVDDGALTYSLVTNVEHGTLTFDDNGSFSYKPDTGYVGTDTFTYMITDSEGLTDTATVNFVVNEPENE